MNVHIRGFQRLMALTTNGVKLVDCSSKALQIMWRTPVVYDHIWRAVPPVLQLKTKQNLWPTQNLYSTKISPFSFNINQ